MVPYYIYHYTSIEVLNKLFEGITEDVTKKKKLFTFYGSSIFSMNDPSEFKHGFNLIWKELPMMEKILGIKEDKYKISKFWSRIKTNKKINELNNEFIEAIYESPYSPFVICFSRKGDSLPLWSMYGDKGFGVCLKFCELVSDINMYNDVPHVKLHTNIQSIDVEYGKMVNDSILWNSVYKTYESYYNQIQEYDKINEIITQQVQTLALMCVTTAPYLKDSAYSYEEETRLKCENPPKIMYNTNRHGKLISYALMKIPISYLHEIIIGPAVDFYTTKRILKQMCKTYGLENVEISKSKIPYRTT